MLGGPHIEQGSLGVPVFLAMAVFNPVREMYSCSIRFDSLDTSRSKASTNFPNSSRQAVDWLAIFNGT